jgi:hypothetical protein
MSGAISKELLGKFQNLPVLCEWMVENWHKRSPSKLFLAYTSTNKGTMQERKDYLERQDRTHLPDKQVARYGKTAAHAAAGAWAVVPHSAKTQYITKYDWFSCN